MTVRLAAVQLPACSDDLDANRLAAEMAVRTAAAAGAASWRCRNSPPFLTSVVGPRRTIGVGRRPRTGRRRPLCGAREGSRVLFFPSTNATERPVASTTQCSASTPTAGRCETARSRESWIFRWATIRRPNSTSLPIRARRLAARRRGRRPQDRRPGLLRSTISGGWRALRAKNAELVIVPVAGSGGDDMDFFIGEMRTHARENGLAVVCANKVGDEHVGGGVVDNYGYSTIIEQRISAGPTTRRRRPDWRWPSSIRRHRAKRGRLRYYEHRREDRRGKAL